MEETVKKRLVGAIVLVALAVIFVPFLLEEKESPPQRAVELEKKIPAQPTQKFRSGLVPDEKTATQQVIRAESQEDDFNISERLDLSEFTPPAMTGNSSAPGAKADEEQLRAKKKPAKVSRPTAAPKPEKKSVVAATEKKQGRGDPDYTVSNFWHSRNIGRTNLAHYSNREVDRLIEEGIQETDIVERAPIYRKIHALMANDRAAVFLFFRKKFLATSSRFAGVKASPENYYTSMPYWSISIK